MKKLKKFWALNSLLFLLSSASFAKEKSKWEGWSFLAYHGRTTYTVFRDLIVFAYPRVFETEITSIEMAKRIDGWTWDNFQIEVAGNLTRRWQKAYQRDFFEGNVFLLFRWTDFPWNSWIKTTIAFGEGVSYAEEVPYIEYYDKTNSEETSRFLNFLAWDVTLSLPKYPNWALVYRVHHRSGVWGLYNNVSGGSNVTALGLKYIF